ncbi:MAG TPA: preprotein translocase subunit SecY [Phycisphaerae bacterium]|nr:preprotein translocase subunit SecY [Phycisphaerae bacterium]
MPFRYFRYVTGALIGVGAIWLIADSAMELSRALSGAGSAVFPAIKIVAGLMLLGAYYYAVWAGSPIKRAIENIFAIPELLRKLAFTLGLLCIYRIGFHVPLPGLNQEQITKWMGGAEGPVGQAVQIASMFTGGNLGRSTLFGLGIMPYISASIIFQLLTTVVPALERLQKEGPAGYKKIQEYTRYATVLLCVVQAAFWMRMMTGGDMVYLDYRGSVMIFLAGVIGMTAGTMFLMWLGEQIDEYGIGNGVSLLIMAGIVARLPGAIRELVATTDLSLTGAGKGGAIGPIEIVFLVGAFVFVVAGTILITQAQRRIPIQQAKHTRGRRVYGGLRHYMPLRVNHGGVMPLIFASSLMIFPSLLFNWIANNWSHDVTRTLKSAFEYGTYTYSVVMVAMIFFFAYFWTTVQFRPKEMAEQLRDSGSFIPGLRPGKRTADYLERVMERITYCGAAFLSVIAVIPMVVASALNIPFRIASFLGGTGLLIVVSVTLDLVQRIESNLVMRNYGGFLGGSTRIKGSR